MRIMYTTPFPNYQLFSLTLINLRRIFLYVTPELSDILLVICSLFSGAVFAYYYGVSKGEKSLMARGDLVRPSLRELQIEGLYRIKKGNLDHIYEELLKNLPVYKLQYSISRFGNRIDLINKRITRTSVGDIKGYFQSLEKIRAGIVFQMELLFTSINNHYEIETICRPALYYSIAQNVQFDFLQSHVEDAQESCILFTKEVINSLNVEIIKQPSVRKEKDKPALTLYTNSPKNSDINLKAENMIKGVKYEIIYCGWIDRTFLGLLEKAQDRGVKIRIITRDPQGSSKMVRTDFKRLKNSFKENVKINHLVHDRFLLCDESALIGSMYLTDDSKIRYESELYTEDSIVVGKIQQHFESMWEDSNTKNLS